MGTVQFYIIDLLSNINLTCKWILQSQCFSYLFHLQTIYFKQTKQYERKISQFFSKSFLIALPCDVAAPGARALTPWSRPSLATGLSTTSTGVTSLKTSDLITSLGLASRTMAGITPSSFAMAGTGMTSLTGAVTTTVSAMDLSNPIVNPLGNNPLGSNPLGNNPLGLMDPTLASHMGGANPSLGLTSLGGLTGTNLLGGTSLPGVSLHSTNPLSVTNPASLSAGLTGVGVVGTGVGMAGGGISNPVFTSVNPLPTIITTSYDKDGTSSWRH